MIKNLIESYKNLDVLTYKILKNGLKFCFILCLISVGFLLTYEAFIAFPFLYHTGLSMFRLSLIFAIEFIICALVVDSLKKQII